MASFKQTHNELILDFDDTDDRVHGNQNGHSFHAYYGRLVFIARNRRLEALGKALGQEARSGRSA